MGKTEFYEISFGKYSNYYCEYEECGVMIVASSRYPGTEEINNVLGMPWCGDDGIDIECMGITPITKEEIIKNDHYYNQLIINLDTVMVVH